MATVTFDTLKFVDSLEKAQIPREQARAIVDVMRESHDAVDVATKGDLRELELRLRGDINLLRWMMGVTLAGVGAIFVKLFF